MPLVLSLSSHFSVVLLLSLLLLCWWFQLILLQFTLSILPCALRCLPIRIASMGFLALWLLVGFNQWVLAGDRRGVKKWRQGIYFPNSLPDEFTWIGYFLWLSLLLPRGDFVHLMIIIHFVDYEIEWTVILNI